MSEIGDAAPAPTIVLPGFLEEGGDTVGAVNRLHDCYTALVNELNAHANATSTRLSTLESRSAAAETSLSTISANLSTLLSRFPSQIVNTQSSSSSSSVAAIARPIKGAKLGQFSSKAQDVERFLTDLRDNIELQGPLTFTTDYQKSIYMATFLRNTQSASDWMSGIHSTTPDLLNHFARLTDTFTKHFGSANKVEDALRKLKALKQTGSAATYAARFCKLSAALPQEQFFLKTMFFNGLKEERTQTLRPEGSTLRIEASSTHRPQKTLTNRHRRLPRIRLRIRLRSDDATVVSRIEDKHPSDEGRDKEGTLDQLIERSISGDNRIHEFQSATASKATPWTAPKAKSSTTSATPAPSSSTPAPSASSSGPVPMELGAAHVAGLLDPSEKERRKKLGLCVYCGGQHSTDDCQLLKEKNARKAARKGKASPQA
ncbi:Retrotransposon gag protein [Ceratobasidium sp. AG-Ba]|nr:Retrotransposon gag protein [Ceratobasidium sp. AG-Ba]